MEKPTPPGDYDCCESGCEPCVWDIYQAEMTQWRAAQANNPEAEGESPSTQPLRASES